MRLAAALADGLGQPVPVETLATQGDQERGADIGMGAKPAHHRLGVAVGVTARETDDMHVLLAEGSGDFAGHMVGAFDQIGDDDNVTDALSPVSSQIAPHQVALPFPFAVCSR